MDDLSKELNSPLNGKAFTCPKQGRWSSFQLVDESGVGKPYAGLLFTAIDSQGLEYVGMLDDEGKGRVNNHCAGPLAIKFEHEYAGGDSLYEDLMTRYHYPLKITDFQVRAEQTRFVNSDGSRTTSNPAKANADTFYQVEVRDFVEFSSHLPPASEGCLPICVGSRKLMREHGRVGVVLMPFKHTVLEVRPLRALRLVLSLSAGFSALNLYQLALMASLSYSPFGQRPETEPVEEETVSFDIVPSVGNWFGSELVKFSEAWRLDAKQASAYYPLYEDVAYSKRFEIVPFDPVFYPENNPKLDANQETPAKIHFLDDRKSPNPTDTQAFITHSDEIVLIAVRGTNELVADLSRDLDAMQVPFTHGVGRAHRGFYESAITAYTFVTAYLDRFHTDQKLLICGHSLGGAVAFLLAEMLRRRKKRAYNIQLYTYGAPRAGDTVLIEGAAELAHQRIVNHNDLITSLPPPWVNIDPQRIIDSLSPGSPEFPKGLPGIAIGLINVDGDPYCHHGTLQHFMPVQFSPSETSAILWSPGCKTIIDKALCDHALRQTDGLPERTGVLSVDDHSMIDSYIPACWATLRRHQQALENQRALVSRREHEAVSESLAEIKSRLRTKQRLASAPEPQAPYHRIGAAALQAEIQAIERTQQRLDTLTRNPVQVEAVYGSWAGQPLLDEALARWQAHPENTRAEQLAMAPGPSARELEVEEWLKNTPKPTFDEIMAKYP